MNLALLFLLAVMTPEPPDDAVFEAPDTDYAECVALARKDPAAASERARRWSDGGGGAPAAHCLALADLAAGKPRLAAIRLAELAERSDSGDALARARLFGQAALAFIEADDAAGAEAAILAASALAPNGGEIDLYAARVHVAAGKNQAAIDAVDRAERLQLVSPAGYVARARARIALQQLHEAAEDIVLALKLDPLNVDALTLRGDLAQQGIEIAVAVRSKRETAAPKKP